MDYVTVLKRSWELTKKNKWLWVYGLVLAAFAGGGFSGQTGGGPPSFPTDELDQDLPEKTSQVLGQATSAMRDWLTGVPTITWVLLTLGALFLIVLFIVISWTLRNWAKGALIAALDEADLDKEVTLASTSPRGLANLWPLMLYGLIALGITLGTILGISLLVALGYLLFSFSNTVKIIWLVLSAIVGGLSLVVLLVLFAMVSVYADRLIVLQQSRPWSAWKAGFRLARRHFLPTLVMGIINHTVSCVAGCLAMIGLLIILGIPLMLLIVPLFQNGPRFPDLPTLITIILLIFIFISLNMLIRAIITVFQYGIWNLFFQEIMTSSPDNESGVSV